MAKLAPITYHASKFMIASREDPRISYLDAMRARYGSEIYPIDPYVEVFFLEKNVWCLHINCPTMGLSNYMYLIKGPEKSLLIDSGYGLGNLKGLCEQLTGQQVLLAISHNHLDHSHGCFQWSKVYCHDFCADLMEEIFTGMTEEEWHNQKNFCSGAIGTPGFIERDIIRYNPNTKFIHMQSHDVINLGDDYDIELIHMGGHAPGLSVFLDRKGRAIYTADAIQEMICEGAGIGIDMSAPKKGEKPITHYDAIKPKFYQKNLHEVADRIDEFDVIRDAHACMDSDPRVVTDLRDAVDAAIADPYAYTLYSEQTFPGYVMVRGISDCRYLYPENMLVE